MGKRLFLKECPFCGAGRATLHLFTHGEGVRKFFIVRCERGLGGCGANITGTTRRDAADAWNRRLYETEGAAQ